MSKKKKIDFEHTLALGEKRQVICLLFKQMFREVLTQGLDKSEKMEISYEETFEMCAEYVRKLIMDGCDADLEEIEEGIEQIREELLKMQEDE